MTMSTKKPMRSARGGASPRSTSKVQFPRAYRVDGAHAVEPALRVGGRPHLAAVREDDKIDRAEPPAVVAPQQGDPQRDARRAVHH